MKHPFAPAALLSALLSAAPAPRAGDGPAAEPPPPPAWEKPSAIPAESPFLADRREQPQNHFLFDGVHGFTSGRVFYQAVGEGEPFLWPGHAFLQGWPEREWLGDSSFLSVSALGGNEVGDPMLGELAPGRPDGRGNRTPYSAGSLDWGPDEALRLHAFLDQNDHFSYRTFPARAALVPPGDEGDLAWIGENLPPRSSLGGGLGWTHRGAQIAAQFSLGTRWTRSPVTGIAYPWKGFEADFLYRVGDDVDISVRDMEWESAAADSLHGASWQKSELRMGFTGKARGGWAWRLELGYQQRFLTADSAFTQVEERSYPWRFRYRQAWAPGGSDIVKVGARGALSYRDRTAGLEHAQELRETLGRHEAVQILRGYYRETLRGRTVPTELLREGFAPAGDTLFARLGRGRRERGAAATLEYRYRRDAFSVAAGVDGAMEWGVPVFRLAALDSSQGLRRAGDYEASPHVLRNGTARLAAGGRLFAKPAAREAEGATWRLHGGLRAFQGADAERMEFAPSPWWAGGGAAWGLPSDLRLEAALNYVGPKEVRGWGSDFRVPAHWENDLGIAQALFDDRLELSASFLHAFGEDVLDHPGGNPLRFRILVGLEGRL